MSALDEIQPRSHARVMDLVRDAGVDVSDWANVKGGEDNAAANPKYCYEWSFVRPATVVVLNLWYAGMQELEGTIMQELNLRDSAQRYARAGKRIWEKRAINMDLAIQAAFRGALPVRVIVCEGQMRDSNDMEADASHVERRFLDPLPWAITTYDWNTGRCEVTRGAPPSPYADQFALLEEEQQPGTRRTVVADAFVRSAEVRRRVLDRAMGKCEWCSEPGFKMADGRTFLETHHIIPLADGGSDVVKNVAALCANHHREAHHGALKGQMQRELLERIVTKYPQHP